MDKEERKSTGNSLLQCGATVLSLVAPFRRSDRGVAVESDFREKVLAGFDEMERLAYESRIAAGILRDAKYALAAFVDEAVLSSSWPGRLAWMSKPLQLEMFGDHLAGEGFFDKLNLLRQGGECHVDLLELYYICLQLGFEGIYKIRGLEHLTALQVDLRSQIENYRGVVDPRLSPAGAARVGLMTRVRREIPCWVIGVFTVSVVFFTYLGYSLVVSNLMNESVSTITQSREAILRFVEKRPAAVEREVRQ
jgi:type VI secretion system protein ImpK